MQSRQVAQYEVIRFVTAYPGLMLVINHTSLHARVFPREEGVIFDLPKPIDDFKGACREQGAPSGHVGAAVLVQLSDWQSRPPAREVQ